MRIRHTPTLLRKVAVYVHTFILLSRKELTAVCFPTNHLKCLCHLEHFPYVDIQSIADYNKKWIVV